MFSSRFKYSLSKITITQSCKGIKLVWWIRSCSGTSIWLFPILDRIKSYLANTFFLFGYSFCLSLIHDKENLAPIKPLIGYLFGIEELQPIHLRFLVGSLKFWLVRIIFQPLKASWHFVEVV